MPNYCNNVVEIRGPQKVVKALVDHRLDFQKIYPYPKDLDIVAGRSGADDSPEQIQLVAAEESNLAKYGYKNWYDWCVSEWGTKWNAGGSDNADMQIDFDEDGDDSIALFQFDTAWAPALGVLQKLKDDHPELSVECRYHEPGVGFMGVWTDGQDRCYDNIQGSQDTFWQSDDGRLLDETFDIVESMQEWEADQETEAERKVRELIVERKAQNIIG
ncbi:MAG: hypothetical protein JW384_02340 [Nitrosomonadaceae bacterium]|nr:hypothetical protein [Nitrosomonadaceae bacterium]